jgi:hypothetical protein
MRILAGIVVTIIILMTVGCTGQSDKKGCILPKDCQLKTGDIVFRKGGGVTSHAVVMAEGNGD